MTSSEKPRLTVAPQPTGGRGFLWLEFVAIFLCLPIILSFYATRWNIHVALWVIGIYGLVLMERSAGVSLSVLWRGDNSDWSRRERRIAAVLFTVATAFLVFLAAYLVPWRLFTFPMQRPGFWLLVMVLYPLLSVLPQEFVLRSFFFWRYAPIFPNRAILIGVSAFCFGFVHVVLHNAVAPLLSGLAGVVFATSYARHRSLKWVTLEHAAYGCMVFTVGLGGYFLVGGYRP